MAQERERLMDPRTLVGGQFSIRKFFEAHAYSGTEYVGVGNIERYSAGCECGMDFGPLAMVEDRAHAELLEQYSGHMTQALLGQLLISLTESLVADRERKTQERPGG